jgi:hypothetical protein
LAVERAGIDAVAAAGRAADVKAVGAGLIGLTEIGHPGEIDEQRQIGRRLGEVERDWHAGRLGKVERAISAAHEQENRDNSLEAVALRPWKREHSLQLLRRHFHRHGCLRPFIDQLFWGRPVCAHSVWVIRVTSEITGSVSSSTS